MQRSDWFISQDDIAWFQDDPGNGDALLLATGKGRNHLIHQVLQSNFIQCQFNCLFLFFVLKQIIHMMAHHQSGLMWNRIDIQI